MTRVWVVYSFWKFLLMFLRPVFVFFIFSICPARTHAAHFLLRLFMRLSLSHERSVCLSNSKEHRWSSMLQKTWDSCPSSRYVWNGPVGSATLCLPETVKRHADMSHYAESGSRYHKTGHFYVWLIWKKITDMHWKLLKQAPGQKSKLISSLDHHYFYSLEEILYMIPFRSRIMRGLFFLSCSDVECNSATLSRLVSICWCSQRMFDPWSSV